MRILKEILSHSARTAPYCCSCTVHKYDCNNSLLKFKSNFCDIKITSVVKCLFPSHGVNANGSFGANFFNTPFLSAPVTRDIYILIGG